jgi:biofilm PGA synthesis lipoprotein PgaB
MAATIKSLYQQGAMHIAYYPDDPIKQHPDVETMRKAFALKSSQLVP